jgi:hypothetical protein
MQQDETQPNEYPRGRGYGHDYMRGGEVFNGYGYKERDEYQRTRGGEPIDDADVEETDSSTESPRDGLSASEAGQPSPSGANSADAPVPQLEHTYGSAGAQRNSRSLYVTQAQLQQRVYRPHEQA